MNIVIGIFNLPMENIDNIVPRSNNIKFLFFDINIYSNIIIIYINIYNSK